MENFIFPKNYDEDEIEKLKSRLPTEKWEEISKIATKLYVLDHDDNLFIFRPVKYMEWKNLMSSIAVVQGTTQVEVEFMINKAVCEKCVVFNTDKLQDYPGLYDTIADFIYKLGGFNKIGTTVIF